MYPYNHQFGQTIQNDANGYNDRAFLAHILWSAEEAAAAAAAGVHAAITGSATAETVVDDEITNPPCPRNLTVTPGGTTADVAAGDVVIAGTNEADETISETFTFLANATDAVVGAKAFKTVTSITIHQQDGAAATFAIGYGDKLGLGYLLAHNTVLAAFLNNVKESTAPTVAVSETVLESNTIDLNSALDGHAVDAYLMV